MIEYLTDTNIFIAVFKGNTKLKLLIENLSRALDTTVYAELFQGLKDKSEVTTIEKYLTRFDACSFRKKDFAENFEIDSRLFKKS